MTIIFINIFENNLSKRIKLMHRYIPAISIPSDKILKKKNENIYFIITFLFKDFELNTNNLLVINANNTESIQLIKLFT